LQIHNTNTTVTLQTPFRTYFTIKNNNNNKLQDLINIITSTPNKQHNTYNNNPKKLLLLDYKSVFYLYNNNYNNVHIKDRQI
jgi:hypothetical protein